MVFLFFLWFSYDEMTIFLYFTNISPGVGCHWLPSSERRPAAAAATATTTTTTTVVSLL